MDADEEGVRDVVNLVVNATLTYLTHPAANLRDVARLNYSEPLRTILRWCSQA